MFTYKTIQSYFDIKLSVSLTADFQLNTLRHLQEKLWHMHARGCHYLHTGALLAAAVSRAHIWAAISDVEVIQSPGLLLVKGSLLEPTEPCSWRPEDID